MKILITLVVLSLSGYDKINCLYQYQTIDIHTKEPVTYVTDKVLTLYDTIPLTKPSLQWTQ